MHETCIGRQTSRMTAAWPCKPFTFRGLRKTFGAMWVRCDICRGLCAAEHWQPSGRGLSEQDVQLLAMRQRGYSSMTEPIKEAGMQDYRQSSGPSITPRRLRHFNGVRSLRHVDRAQAAYRQGEKWIRAATRFFWAIKIQERCHAPSSARLLTGQGGRLSKPRPLCMAHCANEYAFCM